MLLYRNEREAECVPGLGEALERRGVYLQAGEELGELREERKKHEANEAGLGGGLGDFIPVHEGSHRETLQLLRVAL